MPFTDSTEPVPAELRTEEFVLRPIVAADTELDYAAVMETREYLRLWRQSTWPEDDFTVEANRKDVIDLEQRHAAHGAFTYTVLDPDGTRCLGCVYVFPTSATFLARSTVIPVGDDGWVDVDAVILFWARLSQMASGMDERLLAALRAWFKDEWKLERTVYVTSEQFTQQVDLLERTDLSLKFELLEPGKPRRRLVFG
ncbi:N-acetyltransferase [Phytoactinopolyspora endophytica]|uniref:N-acetyltransferase n=1 Tax=Phytoactinopolyspora endophytica TaxID=1642495 RepID=UPI00101C8D9A|nr:N-acetyltransferase [Phytoactinopolyspora endophytica]